jgi:hypothetical protein
MFEWHYTKDKQPHGPVNSTQLKALAASGQLLPTDLVWKDGMTQWVPAATLKSMFDSAPTTATSDAPVPTAHKAPESPTDPAQLASIPYASLTTDMNSLAVATLRGFPALTGPRGDFPLTEDELKQLALTAKARAPIRRAAALYFVLFISGLLFAAAFLTFFLLISSRFNSARGGMPPEAAGEILLWLGIIAGLSILCLFASRGTYKCQIWAPITMIVHFSGWILYLIYQFISNYRDQGGTVPEFLIFTLYALIPPAIFLTMSIFALTHISRFLRRPLWMVHLFVQSRL